VDGHDVVGYSNPNAKNQMEVRGIVIINVSAMFGVKCIRKEKRIDLVVSLVKWENVEDVDRLGIDDTYTSILDTQIPLITIPVREGRDISRLVEVAALQTKLKMMGHNTAEEFNQKLIAQMLSQSKK
jgi:HPr kinase/phosphorylase